MSRSKAADRSRIPRHVAIIMDGNGRWARQKGWPRIRGHEEGAKSVTAVLRACRGLGIQYLTLYAFSIENWARPAAEVRALMGLLLRFLQEREHELHENRVRLRVIGRTATLPARVQRELERVIRATEKYKEGQLILALSYGGRSEIADAARRIARRAKDGELDPEEVDEKTVSEALYAPDVPDPDLLIRTSGEMRVSNFLLWQISYSEILVTPVLWPDFRQKEFREAVREYGKRHRRYGGVETARRGKT